MLGTSNGEVVLLPCTTWSARHGLAVPRGCACLLHQQPGFQRHGIEETTLRVKDIGAFFLDSDWVQGLRQIGTLDLSKDKRLAAQLGELIRAYDLETLPE